jgi:hypothetical protein
MSALNRTVERRVPRWLAAFQRPRSEGADAFLSSVSSGDRRPVRYDHPPGADVWRGRWRVRVPGTLPVDQARRCADRGLRRRYHPSRSAACRWPADCRLGSPDHRDCAALRSLARLVCVSADAGQQGAARTGLHNRSNRLSGTRNARAASFLVGLSEARAVIDSVRAARSFPGHGKFVLLRRVGTLARRTGSALHRHHLEKLRAGIAARGCSGRGSRARPRDAHDRRYEHGRRQKPYRHDGVVMGAGVRRADR